MDPVSAFSLACGVIQVVDFSLKISSKCRELYKEGSLSDNDVIEGWAENLEKLCGELNPPVTDGVPLDRLPPNEQELRNLAANCSTTAHVLIHKLDELKVSGSRKKREALKQGFRSIWKKDAIEEIQKRLDSYQKSLDTRILVYVRQLLVETSSEQKRSLRTLDTRYQAIADSLLQGHRSFDELKTIVQSENAATQERIIDLLRIHQNKLSEKESSQRLLDSLHFPDIHCREEQIADAHRETFQWIFDASPSAIRPWDNFVEWLENGEGTYWINGKMGSGKSTLMSYICQDARTSAALAKWGGIGVITPQFFFWNPGSHLQKSIEGLLRSLIYQILQERPDLAPLVASEGPLETWTDRRLYTSFRRITQDSSLRRSKLCLFVDGLDEFAGDQSSLIDLLRSITDGQDVKVCLSSRPYIIFEEAFGKACTLKLQDLTRADIERYTFDKLQSLPSIQSLSLSDGDVIYRIAWEIVERANGVFLWVSLAVKDQLEGIRNHDDPGTLWERLRTMPTEIEDVYVHLLNRISRFYKVETAQILKFVLQINSIHDDSGWRKCSVLDIALSLHKELDYIISSSADICATEILLQCDRTRRRLLTTCSAFLEIKDLDLDSSLLTDLHFSGQQMELYRRGSATVDFLHRSAADFFENGQGRAWLKENLVTEHQTPISDFLTTQVAKIRLLGFPVLDEIERPRYYPWFPKSPQDILYLLCEAEAELGHPPTALCSALDRAMTILHRQRQRSDQTAHWVLLADKQFLEEGSIRFWPPFRKEPVSTVTLTSSSEILEDTPQSSHTELSVVPKDLLGLLACLGLDLYVEESIKVSFSPLSVSYANYLLSCVLLLIHHRNPKDRNVVIEKKLRLVGFLLNQGANPNEAAVQGSLWTLFLERMYSQRNKTIRFSDNGPFLEAAWASAAETFLAAGANIHEQTSATKVIAGNMSGQPEPRISVPYLEGTEGEVHSKIGELYNARLTVQLSVLSCLSYCLSNAPQLPGIQEECIGNGARYVAEISSITYGISTGPDIMYPEYNLSKEQSDRLVPTYEAYILSDRPSSPKVWAEQKALMQQLAAPYHEFFEEKKRRLLPKPSEDTSLND